MDDFYPPALNAFLPHDALNLPHLPILAPQADNNKVEEHRRDAQASGRKELLMQEKFKYDLDEEFCRHFVEGREERQRQEKLMQCSEQVQLHYERAASGAAKIGKDINDAKLGLYGSDGHKMVLALEARCNARFDSYCDEHRVKVWPVLPLHEP